MTICSTATYNPAFAQKCWASQKVYAEKIGANYVQHLILPAPFAVVGGEDFVSNLPVDDEEPSLWLDWDVFVKEDAPNIFSVCPDEGISLFHFQKWGELDILKWMKQYVPELDNKYRNIGVMLGKAKYFRQIHAAIDYDIHYLTRKVPSAPPKYEAVTLLAARKAGVKITDLDETFHAIPPKDGFFVHYAGSLKKLL